MKLFGYKVKVEKEVDPQQAEKKLWRKQARCKHDWVIDEFDVGKPEDFYRSDRWRCIKCDLGWIKARTRDDGSLGRPEPPQTKRRRW